MPAFMIILPTSPAAPGGLSAHQVGQGRIALAHGQAQIAVAQLGVHFAELIFLFHKQVAHAGKQIGDLVKQDLFHTRFSSIPGLIPPKTYFWQIKGVLTG